MGPGVLGFLGLDRTLVLANQKPRTPEPQELQTFLRGLDAEANARQCSPAQLLRELD